MTLKSLIEVMNDEELKEMMVQTNQKLKALVNEGKGDNGLYTQFLRLNQLLDRITHCLL